jgi:hypothetical protein
MGGKWHIKQQTQETIVKLTLSRTDVEPGIVLSTSCGILLSILRDGCY